MGLVNNDLCKTIQFMLATYVAGNPADKITQKGLLDALVSPMNKPITPELQNLSVNRDGNTVFRARYWQGFAEGSASAILEDVCVPGTPSVPKSQDYTLTQVASKKVSVAIEDFRDYCEGRSEVLNKYILDAMDKVREKKSLLLGASIASLVLPYATSLRAGAPVDSNAAPASAKFFENAATGQISPLGVLTVTNEFEEGDYDGAPLLIGRGLLRNYAKLAAIACCNELGQDVSQLGDGTGSDFMYFIDRNLPTTLGNANAFLALRPGWFQQWTQPRFINQYEITKDAYDFNSTIEDPRNGERFDIQSRMQNCDFGQIDVVISQNFDLFSVPADMYDPADPLSTYKGGVQFIAI